MTVALAPVGPELRGAVLALAPRPEQAPFSGLPAETLPAAEADPARLPVAVIEDGVPAGFFVLDAGATLAPGADELALRSFFVDAAAQGRGVAAGALAALPAFVAEQRPGARAVVLGVNARNDPARRVYLRAGFVDTGAVLEGPLGPQHVLRLELGPGAT